MSAEKRRHVADIDFVEFYASALQDRDGTCLFVQKVESLPPEHRKAKVILHQAARMVWLGDRLDEVAHGRPALQILFYLIAAEAVAKMAFGFGGDGQSKRYVRRFFEEICGDEHREKLGKAFGGTHFLPWKDAVDLLYKVRCNVAHEGMYFNMNLRLKGDPVPVMTHIGSSNWVSYITLEELRRIILEGAILGCQRLLVDAGVDP